MVHLTQKQTQDIQKAYEFIETYDKNKGASSNQRYTNLFLVHVGKNDSFEFVKRYSLKNMYMRVVSWVSSAFGSTKKPYDFDIDTNLQLVSRLYSEVLNNIPYEDKNELNQLAQAIGVKAEGQLPAGDVLKTKIIEASIFLQQLQQQIESKRFVKTKTIKVVDPEPLAKLSPQEQALVTQFIEESEYKDDIKKELSQHVPNLLLGELRKATNPQSSRADSQDIMQIIEKLKPISPPEVSARAQFITEFGRKGDFFTQHKSQYASLYTQLNAIAALTPDEKDLIVTTLIPYDTSLTETLKMGNTDALVLALRKALSTNLPQESLSSLRTALSKLAPLSPTYSSDTPRLENLTAYIGSSFNKGQERTSFQENKTLVLDFLAHNNLQHTDAYKLIDNAITLTKHSTHADVKKHIDEKGKCLLLGGFDGHPMVYAITKQSNGKYTVEIFNQEPKFLLADEQKSSVDKTQGYLIANDVSLDKSGLTSFLGGGSSLLDKLITLCSSGPEEAEGYFATNIASILGKQPKASDEIHALLRPNVGGTIAARELLAVLAKESGEAEKILPNFDAYVLERFESSLRQALLTPITTDVAYTDAKKLKDSIKTAIQERQEELSQYPDAKVKLYTYNDLLDRFEQNLQEAQKTIFTTSLTEKIASSNPVKINLPKGLAPPPEAKSLKADKINPTPLQLDTVQLLANIRSGPIDEALTQLSSLNPKSELYMYAVELFFKRVGSLENLQKINWKNPQDSIENLKNLIVNITSMQIDAENSELSHAEHYGVVLAATYALEGAFKKLSPADTVFAKAPPSVLASEKIYQNISKLKTSDPFWSSCFAEMKKLRESLSVNDKVMAENLFNADLSKQGEVVPNEHLATSVVAYIRNIYVPAGKEVDASMRQDRLDQKNRIAAEKAAEQQKIKDYVAEKTVHLQEITSLEKEVKVLEADLSNLQREFNRLKGEEDKAKQDYEIVKKEMENRKAAITRVFEKKYNHIIKNLTDAEENVKKLRNTKVRIDEKKALIAGRQKEIAAIDAKIAISEERIREGIDRDVRADKQYWPWGIVEGDDVKWKSLEWTTPQIAGFFLAKHPFIATKLGKQDVLPKVFREFADTSTITKNIFNKTDGVFDGKMDLVWDNGKLHFVESSFPFTDEKSVTRPLDIYAEGIENEKYNEIYRYVYNKDYIPEGKIPLAAVDLKVLGGQEIGWFERGLNIVGLGGSKAKTVVLEDEVRELCQLHTTPEMQIDSTISYFKNNPRKFASNDGRMLLHALLFESDVLLNAFSNEKTQKLVVSRLQTLFSSVIYNAIELKNPENCANMLWIAANVQKYLNSCPPANKDYAILRPQDIFAVATTFGDRDFEASWPVVFESVQAACGQLFTGKLDSIDAEKLFIYGLLANAHKKGEMDENQFSKPREDLAKSAETTFKELLASTPSQTTLKLLNAHAKSLLGAMYKALSEVSFKEGGSPGVFVTPDDKTTLSLTEGKFTSTDPSIFRDQKQPLPDYAKEALLTSGLYKNNQALQHLRCNVEGNFLKGYVVYITDDRTNTKITLDQRAMALFIEKGNLPVCHYLLTDDKIAFKDNTILSESYAQLFHEPTKTTYLCDKETLEPKFTVKSDGNIVRPDGLLLQTPQSSELAAFEAPACSLYWADESQKIKEIEFPRLGISLKRTDKDSLKRTDKDRFGIAGTDWTVSDEQFVPQLDKASGFLVVKNSKGEKKVIVPVWDLQPNGEFEFNTRSTHGRTIEYALKDSKLVPNTVEARFYLAKLYLAKGNIEEAEALLYTKEAQISSRKLSNKESFDAQVKERKLDAADYAKSYRNDLHEEEEILLSIAHMPIKAPSARILKLQMHALYLSKRNQAQFPKEALQEDYVEVKPPSKDALTRELELIKHYLEYVPETKTAQLETANEFFVLTQVMRGLNDLQKKEHANPQLDPIHENWTAALSNRTNELKLTLEANLIEQQPELAPAKKESKTAITKDAPSQERYEFFRRENQFPFNPHSVTKDEFLQYYPSLQEEVQNIQSQEDAKTNGLLATLTTISQFANDASVQAQARSLLEGIEKKSHMSTRDMQMNLYPLALMQEMTIDQGITKKLAQEYFVASKKPKKSPVSLDLLSSKAPEIKKGDLVAKDKFTGLTHDIQVAESQSAGNSYELVKDLKNLKTTLEEEKIKATKLLAYQETLIVNTVREAMRQDAKRTVFPSMEELALLAARKDYDKICKANYPQLSESGRQNLQEAVKKYLFQKETVQQYGRCLDATVAAIKDPSQSQLDILAENLDKSRAYPPDHPFALIFLFIETVQNLKLRIDQVQTILKFAESIQKGEKDLVLQMIMGAGKTAVLQPFLAILLSNPDSLSCVMIPEMQFQSVRETLAYTLGKAADQLLVTFPYDIELSKNPTYLRNLLNTLKETKQNGGVVLLSPRQAHSLNTSFKEAFHALSTNTEKKEQLTTKLKEATNPKKRQEYVTQLEAARNEEEVNPEDIALYEKKIARYDLVIANIQAQLKDCDSVEERTVLICDICSFIKKNCVLQMDEIHKIMDPTVVFKRSIGEPTVFDKDGGYERPTILAELMIKLARDPILNAKVSIDFADAIQTAPDKDTIVKKGTAINEQLYLQEVRPALVQTALELLQSKNSALKTLISANENNRAIIERFIMQDFPSAAVEKSDKEWIVANITDKKAKDLISTLAHSIARVLPVSLLKECKSNYGKDPDLDAESAQERKYIARPYEAPDAPKPTMYADAHEKLIYSLQYYTYCGIPTQDARDMLLELKKSHDSAVANLVPKTETQAYQKFKALMEEYKQSDASNFFADPESATFANVVKAYQIAISKDPASLIEFCQTRLFQQNTIYNTNVTSTPVTIAGAARRVFGYTGTIHKAILAAMMEAVPEVGTDGKTITAMENSFLGDTPRASVSSLAPNTNLAQNAIDQFKDPDYFMFIDSGNWLKEEKIDKFAEKMLTECGREDIEGIVYHDANSKLVCVEKVKKTNENEKDSFIVVPFLESRLQFCPEKRLTIIRSKYETGTNIPQVATAKALMSVRKNMTLQDALQAAFRMRKILIGQSVSLKFSDDVKSHMAQGIVEGLLSHPQLSAFITTNQPINWNAFKDALLSPALGLEVTDDFLKVLETSVSDYNRKGKFTLLSFQESFNQNFAIDSKSTWRYFASNLSKVEKAKNWAAARFKMRDAFEKPLEAILTNNAIPLTDRKEFFKKICDTEGLKQLNLFIETENVDLFDDLTSLQKEDTAQEAIDHEVARYTNALKVLQTLAHPAAIEQEVKAIREPELKTQLEACVDVKEIPDTISRSVKAEGVENQSENQKETQTEQEKEGEKRTEEEKKIEADKEIHKLKIARPEIKTYKDIAPYLPNQDKAYDIDAFESSKFETIDGVLPKELDFPGRKSIRYSPNQIISSDELTSREHAQYHLAANYMLAIKDQNGLTNYILLSQEDAAKVREGLLKNPKRSAILCELNGDVVATSSPEAELELKGEELANNLVQAKFFTIKINYNATELNRLKTFLDKTPELRYEAREYFRECLQYLKTAAQEFPDTPLSRLLRQETGV